jgi:hypothetical protein
MDQPLPSYSTTEHFMGLLPAMQRVTIAKQFNFGFVSMPNSHKKKTARTVLLFVPGGQ